eukprot:CAMPEP_0204398702 /NCGR_PEP_ID=MMETSP0470-20130426/2979_1 /ASSEMBLY_ACC=CAM_ASM_000385 /TAXON_ID=2969 /ORGANISM="Oxyrrhis marina" /LENGTH=260 /DNA_ID=CAMNT_0051393357 /DNA_START=51 /DNA_END=833 /DNA_ORIENTATION=-
MAPTAAIIASGLAVASGLGQSCTQGPVGSCYVFGCHSSRGPTVCESGNCYCDAGYCATGSAPQRCRARVGSCQYFPCVGHGGLLTGAECVDGVCLCHTMYHAAPDGKTCVSGWAPSPKAAALAAAPQGNSSEYHEQGEQNQEGENQDERGERDQEGEQGEQGQEGENQDERGEKYQQGEQGEQGQEGQEGEQNQDERWPDLGANWYTISLAAATAEDCSKMYGLPIASVGLLLAVVARARRGRAAGVQDVPYTAMDGTTA